MSKEKLLKTCLVGSLFVTATVSLSLRSDAPVAEERLAGSNRSERNQSRYLASAIKCELKPFLSIGITPSQRGDTLYIVKYRDEFKDEYYARLYTTEIYNDPSGYRLKGQTADLSYNFDFDYYVSALGINIKTNEIRHRLNHSVLELPTSRCRLI